MPNGGALAFTPKSLPGLVAWYRADLGVTVATGVSSWADQSGTGDANKNLTQATGTKQPTLNTADAAYNNQPTLSFARASVQALHSGTWSAAQAQPSTTFIVGNDDGTATNQFYCDGNAAATQVLGNNGAGNYQAYAGTTLAGGTPSSSPRILAAVFNGASSSLFISAKTAVATGNAGATGLTGFTAGAAGDSVSNTLNGKIAEIIIYSGALSAAQIAQVLTYLGARYAIAIGA